MVRLLQPLQRLPGDNMEILFSLFILRAQKDLPTLESSQGIELQGIELQGTLDPLTGLPQSMDSRPHTSHGY